MSSFAKPVSSAPSPVAASRVSGGARSVASLDGGPISELFGQGGIRGEADNQNFENFNDDGRRRDRGREQPTTLKLQGTSRSFTMLFEENTAEDLSVSTGNREYGGRTRKPAFQAYMNFATSLYDNNTRAIKGESNVRGGSMNIAM